MIGIIKYRLLRWGRTLPSWLNRYTLVCSLILTLFFYSNLTHNRTRAIEIVKESYEKELFVSVSYFYPTSKSLGNNSVAVVLTGSRLVLYEYTNVTFKATNGTHETVSTVPTEMVTPRGVPCPWGNVFATTTLIENVTSISIFLGNRFAEIPFQTPKTKEHDVVTCISPLFANEQWQFLVFAAHIYRMYGSHMHLYIRSMVSPVFDLMQAYEKEGYLTLQPWVRLGLSSVPLRVVDPNRMVPFRNQEAAQTDCLLQYKETAKFITFMDLDDILIPRVGSTYLEEFEYFFHTNPAISFLNYEKQNVELRGKRDSSHFNLPEMFGSIRYSKNRETGKSVMRPSTFNSTWIHWPLVLPNNTIKYEVAPEMNSIVHLRTFQHTTGNSSSTIEEPLYSAETFFKKHSEILIRKESIESIQSDFERMLRTDAVSEVFPTLPREWYYFDLIAPCYYEKFHKLYYGGRKEEIGCVGPDSCDMPPQPGTSCVNAGAMYSSSEPGQFYSIHHFRNPVFYRDIECVK